MNVESGVFSVVGGARKLTFADVASGAHTWGVAIPGEEPGLEAVARFEPSGTTFPFGVHFCSVSIDRETGQLTLGRFVSVDDVGNIINPLLAHGQRLGGIIQGLGQALCEEVRYDESGQLMTATFMDYAMPRAAMFPRIELDSTCTPSPLNPLGAKVIGELGTIGCAFTPTEIKEAWSLRTGLVALFPAGRVGPGYVRDVLRAMPDVSAVAAGGITPENAGDFIRAGAAAVVAGDDVAVGEARHYDGMTRRARAFIDAIDHARMRPQRPSPSIRPTEGPDIR